MFALTKAIVEHHNTIHQTLQQMSKAAALLELQPRLADHEITSDVISRAMNAKRRCKEACVIIRGLELMQSCEVEPGATTAASEFLAQEQPNWTESSIPPLFWEELKNASNLAGPAVNPSKMRPPAAKRQMCFKDEVKAEAQLESVVAPSEASVKSELASEVGSGCASRVVPSVGVKRESDTKSVVAKRFKA